MASLGVAGFSWGPWAQDWMVIFSLCLIDTVFVLSLRQSRAVIIGQKNSQNLEI